MEKCHTCTLNRQHFNHICFLRVSPQVRPWSKVSGTAAAPSGLARSSSKVTRRHRKPRSTMPSSLQMCTEEKCCSCTPSLVSNRGLSTVYLTDDSSLPPSVARKCQEMSIFVQMWKQFHVFIHFEKSPLCWPSPRSLHFHIIPTHSHCSDNYSSHGGNYTLPGR